MSNFWESVKDTAASLGGAVAAPVGAVIDLAQAPFDDKDDNFGTIVNRVAGHAEDMLDPILSNDTISGFAFNKVMSGLETAYREGVSEPLVTGSTMTGHVLSNPGTNWADVFSGAKWGAAYETAQNRSIGQGSFLAQGAGFGLLTGQAGDIIDPLDARAYKQVHKSSPFLTSAITGTTDFTARWYLDPGIIAGKTAKVAREGQTLRKITPNDFVDGQIAPKLEKGFEQRYGVKPFRFLGKDPLSTRTEKFLEYVNTGASGKPLNGTQVLVSSPELRRSSAGPQIAGLLADAAKIEDEAVRGAAQRKVLAVAFGDQDALFRVRQEAGEAAAIEDALKNVAKANVVDLKAHALGEQITANPVLMASMQNQLDNLDDVTKFVNQHVSKLNALLDTSGALKYAPGVQSAGKRALAREEGRGLLRNGEAASGHALFDKPVNVALERARRLAQHPAVSTVYQKSPVHMPLKVITHTALGYARLPMKATDALRTSHLQGVVSTHDWNGALNQLDSMMKLAKVAPGRRMEVLSKGQLVRTESEKAAVITAVEQASMKAMVHRYSAKAGHDIKDGQTLSEFFDELLTRGNAKRAAAATALHGRAYAATKMKNAAERYGEELRVDQIKPAVNLIDDVDGAPVALPLLETQGRNYIPLLDMNLAERTLSREHGRLMRHAKAWKMANYEIGRLNKLKAETGKDVEGALKSWYAFKDHAVDAASWTLRLWKFSVLFRLGYPLRVVMDDHMRIWSQIGGAAIMEPLARESLGNLKYNQITRYRNATKKANEARVELASINALLDEGKVAAHVERAEQIKTLNRRIGSLEGVATKARGSEQVTDQATTVLDKAERLRAERDALESMQGESPEALMARRQELRDFLDLATSEQVKAERKRRLGDKPVVVDGIEYDPAFGGDMGDAYRVAASSNATFDNLAKVGEENLYKGMSGEGSWRVIHNDDPGHHSAWADVLNNQFRQSKVAKFFIDDESRTVEDFTKWIKKPEQRDLRKRLPHFAHDPEDWGSRVKQMVDDYLPTSGLREVVRKGRVTPRQLDRMFADKAALPSVHGATVGHNLGTSAFAQTVGNTMNRLYKVLGELPTDRLSRHPYFAAMYKGEVQALHARRAAYLKSKGEKFTQRDLDDITEAARKNALNDLRRTLFDISAHSNAAHMMRFISPFFAAHQEALSRWWRIVADDPSIIRRFQQGFDIPRKLGLVVDSETGEPVEEGEMPGPGHAILLQMPQAWGGPDPRKKRTDWQVNENSFNLILQNGIMNPGIGPLVQIPLETMVQHYADEESIERVARALNDYPPSGSPLELLLPSTVKRVYSLVQKEKSGEFSRLMATNLQDKMVDFHLAHGGREPNQRELAKITEDARMETITEAWLRLGQNALSPAPASPRSRYEVFRQGWRKINDQADAQGRDFDWRIDRFKAKYGAAYLPVISSRSNNVGNVDATSETVAALKRHGALVGKVNPRFAGSIVGPSGAYQDAESYSQAAAEWLRDHRPNPGDSTTYMSYDDPVVAARLSAVKRGWDRYSDAMGVLTAMAEAQGLQHYTQSEQLSGLKRAIVNKLSEDNIYWGEDYADFNPNEFNTYLDDLKIIASDPKMKDRADVQVLGKYLKVRQVFSTMLEARKMAGGSGSPEAKSNRDLMVKYRDIVAMLAESNIAFEDYWFNGTLERDPMLVEAN